MVETAKQTPKENIIVGSLWMVGISLLLFFIPIINGIIGGIIGGYKVGTAKRALTSAVIPAIVVALGLWTILSILNAPVVGFFAGVAVGVWVLLSDVGLFIGAAIGGAMANREAHI